MEQAVEARTAALEQALAYRQTFISSISHELRTPLYSISGLCAVMQNATDLTAAQSENLGVIASSAEDLQRIVTAILDMAKLESGGMTAESIPFDLRDALESSLESVAHISRAKNIELVLENDVSTDPPGKILGDPHRLRQCLLNLLSNAVKFGRVGDRPAHIKVGWTIESTEEEGTEMFTISVADNGIGIPKSKMNRLFHSFSQIDASITRQYGTLFPLAFDSSLTIAFLIRRLRPRALHHPRPRPRPRGRLLGRIGRRPGLDVLPDVQVQTGAHPDHGER